MRIGLDIDNVITEFDSALFKEFLKEDKNKRNAGVVNPHAQNILSGMFDWSEEETREFFTTNMQRIAQTLPARKNCKKVIDKLLNDGHEIYLITHRAAPDYTRPYEVTQQWLKDKGINYTKLILSRNPDKTAECKEYNIDVMVDDRVSQCLKMRQNGVRCWVMKTGHNAKRKHDLPVVASFNQLYEEINKCKM